MLRNRPQIGLDNVVYALQTADTSSGATYGTVYSLPDIRKLDFDPASSMVSLFTDNKKSFAAETVGDMKMSIEIADVLPEHENRLFGHTYANGITSKNTNDQSPYIALGFRISLAIPESGQTIYRYVWMPKVQLTKAKVATKTKEASIEFGTLQLEASVMALAYNGNYYSVARTDDTNVSAPTLANWFTAPVLSTGADLTGLTVSSIAEGTAGNAGKIEVTFAKVSGASFSLQSATFVSPNIIIATNAGIKAGTWSVGSAGTSVVCRFTPTVAFSSGDDVSAFVTPGIRDNSGVGATTAADVVTIA